MPRSKVTNEQIMQKLDDLREFMLDTQAVHYVSYPVYPPSYPQTFFTVTTSTTNQPKPISETTSDANTQ